MYLPRLAPSAVIVFALLSLPAAAQTEPIAWLPNLESAKNEARASGRLVLVHFWTEDCAPCVALERNVFSQPEVAGAVHAQFVPVKLNANANPATASMLGVTRVPTDVVLTPDGQVIGRLISPSTPMAYVAELSQVATTFKGQSGQSYAGAAASAPQPPQLNSMNASGSSQPARFQPAGMSPQQPVNSVYAGLNLNGLPQAPATPAGASAPPQPYLGDRQSSAPFTAPQNGNATAAMGNAAASNSHVPPASVPSAPSIIDNRYAQAPVNPSQADPFARQAYPGGNAAAAGNAFGQPSPTAASTGPQQSLAATANAAARPDASRLPAGAPPLGFEGYCPVSMRNEWRWVAGDPQFGVIHRGRTYWFASQSQQQQFFANPDYYSPALSGIDAVLAVDHRQQVPGRREHSVDYDNMFYMFSSEASLQQFTANPERYAASVRAAMGIQPGRSVR